MPLKDKAPQLKGLAQAMPRSVFALTPCTALLLVGLSGAAIAAETANGATADAPVLATVNVNAQLEGITDGALATHTRVGKTLQDPHDVPQAITTVTRKIMDEQHASTLKEALRNVSGLTFNAAEGGRSGDNMMLRGFYTFGDIYLDGVRDTAQYNRELFNLEQVDVLRGAAAMLFGRGQAGGVINQVSKTPILLDRNKLTLAGGSQGHEEVKGDFNKRTGATSAVRVNLMKRNEESWRKNPATGAEPEIHRDGVAVSGGVGLGTDNELVLSHITTRTRDLPDYGIGFQNKRPRSDQSAKTFWGIAANFDDSDTNITTATHQYRFSPKTQLRSQVRKSNYERAYWASAPQSAVGTAPSADGQSAKTRQFVTDNFVVQSDLSTSFDAFGMTHDVVSGVEYLYEDSKRWSLQNLAGSGQVARYLKDEVNPATLATYNGDTISYYAQDTIEFIPNWKLLLGGRRDTLSARYSSLNSPQLKFSENSYRTGLSYQPNEGAHYYVSYSDSFSPTADLYQLSGGEFPPERSQVKEVGAKWLFFGGDLALRAAAYEADKQWERNTDLESTAAILSKKRRTRGIELEAAGRITPKWEVFSGVAVMDARIEEVAPGANPNFKGERARNTPPYTYNLWSTYKLTPRWTVGGGLDAKGERTGYSPSSASTTAAFTNGNFDPNKLPSYVRWDAMTSWENKQYALRLNVQNLFNKTYYDALYDNGSFSVPGTARKVIVTAEYKF